MRSRVKNRMEEKLAAYFARMGDDPLRTAFAMRRAVMPWRRQQAVPAEGMAAAWAQMLDAAPSSHRIAYIHVPFCANHCLFCGFYRNACSQDAMAHYTDCLVAELSREANRLPAGSAPIEALYLGGGTPSALSARQLERVLNTARQCLPLTADCEITLEARMTHFDDDKIDACVAAGVNRISIGVQSFDTQVRRRQGRQSSREEAIHFLERLRVREHLALVIDLLYGLPGQTRDVWQQDLRTAVALAPDGVDLYGLNLIPGTPLQRATANGKFPDMATLEHQGLSYLAGTAFLAAEGWNQLSNSHWQRTPLERNRYNRLIKEGVDCLAYGSGAGGLAGGYSYAIESDLIRYGEAVQAGRKPLAGLSVGDAWQPARQRVTAGFEAGCLDLSGLQSLAPEACLRQMQYLAEQWQSAGLLQIDGGRLDLTLAGRFWASNLIFAFDALLSGDAVPALSSASGGRPQQTREPVFLRQVADKEVVS